MKIKEVIDYKIGLLLDLLLTDGVSPSDLANNIFLEEYSEIVFHKDKEMVIAELIFIENGTKEVKMVYSYDGHMKVQRIEEYINSNKKLLWDRSMREQELINEIIDLMKTSYTVAQIDKFISTLPDFLRTKMKCELIKTA